MHAIVEVIAGSDKVSSQARVGEEALQVGRSPSNDIIVNAPRVSWHHAVLWCEGGGLWVRDSGSRNGVRINGRAISGASRLEVGDLVALGGLDSLRVLSLPESLHPVIVRDLATGVALAVRGTLRIGDSSMADLRIDEGDLTVHLDDDGVWLETPDGLEEVELGTQFEVGGRKFVVERGADARVATKEVTPSVFPVRVSTTLNGVTGPEATVSDLDGRLDPLTVSADNAAVLLHMLAESLQSEREEGRDDPGWRSDRELNSGIWGRRGELDPNAIHVVIYRLRKDFEAAGYDGRIIEKKRRRTRLRVAEISIR
jgi:hypothetical protein